MPKRGPEAGREAVAKLEALIAYESARGGILPMNGKALHLGLICEALAVGRATIHQNPAFGSRLRAYAEEKGVAFSVRDLPAETERQTESEPRVAQDSVPAAKLRAAERRVSSLEKRVSELTARNASLAAQLRRSHHTEDHLLSRGRRLHPSSDSNLTNIDGDISSGDLS